jgi:hypothetical protein
MKKVPTLFVRDPEMRERVTRDVVPGLEWILTGGARATEKLDGTSCLIRDGKLHKRYMVKWERKAPAGFEPTGDPDPVTKKQPGWVPVGDGPEDQWHREAFALDAFPDGTYELVGPKVQGDPYRRAGHQLLPHGRGLLPLEGFDFDTLAAFLEDHELEGIVWWNEKEPVAKIKRRDFGLPWPVRG